MLPEGVGKLIWEIAAGFIYAQVKKIHRRRKLVKVEHLMLCGEQEKLTTGLKALGLSGKINTAFVERLNLTIRQGVAFLVRRPWGLLSSHRSSNYTWNGGGDTITSSVNMSPCGCSSPNLFRVMGSNHHAATVVAPPPWQPDSLYILGRRWSSSATRCPRGEWKVERFKHGTNQGVKGHPMWQDTPIGQPNASIHLF